MALQLPQKPERHDLSKNPNAINLGPENGDLRPDIYGGVM